MDLPGRTGGGEREIGGGAREAAAFELLRAAVAGLAAGEIDVSDATRSMAPLLVGGERLRWRRRAPRFGDVAVFFRGRALVAHRVVGRSGAALRTKGDALAALDGWTVPPEDVVGVAEAVVFPRGARSLAGAPARLYALAAAAWSRGGGALFGAAARLDALLGAGASAWRARRAAFWLQRAGALALHGLLFRAAHRTIDAPRRAP